MKQSSITTASNYLNSRIKSSIIILLKIIEVPKVKVSWNVDMSSVDMSLWSLWCLFDILFYRTGSIPALQISHKISRLQLLMHRKQCIEICSYFIAAAAESTYSSCWVSILHEQGGDPESIKCCRRAVPFIGANWRLRLKLRRSFRRY